MALVLWRIGTLFQRQHHQAHGSCLPRSFCFFSPFLQFFLISAFFSIFTFVVSSSNPSDATTPLSPPPVCHSTFFSKGDYLKELEKSLDPVTPSEERLIKNEPAFHHAYEVRSDRLLEEHDLRITEFVHGCGLSVWSVSTPPSEKESSFSICFRTPVTDSTGLPHVLEHAVLQGSDGFPVRSLFSQLFASSLHTYLNASTWPDRTCFSFASLNKKDFYNLFKVYMDAVFRPLATKDPYHLKQEGCRLQLVPKNSTTSSNNSKSSSDEKEKVDCSVSPSDCHLAFSGVVYSEMKGSWSNPEAAEEMVRLHYLFPNVKTYKERAGGKPKEIPSLTFESLKEFHSKFYNYQNAWIVFYGPDSVWDRLEELHKFINSMSLNGNRDYTEGYPVTIDTQVALQCP